MFSKVATENILSEQHKLKKKIRQTKNQLSCPGRAPHLRQWQSHPTFPSSPLLGTEVVQPKKQTILYAYIFLRKYSTKNNS